MTALSINGRVWIATSWRINTLPYKSNQTWTRRDLCLVALSPALNLGSAQTSISLFSFLRHFSPCICYALLRLELSCIVCVRAAYSPPCCYINNRWKPGPAFPVARIIFGEFAGSSFRVHLSRLTLSGPGSKVYCEACLFLFRPPNSFAFVPSCEKGFVPENSQVCASLTGFRFFF